MASPNLTEIVTTTIRNRSRKLADNVSDNTALLYKLRSKGNRKPFSGGYNIVQELEYDENQTYKRYSGYEILDISPSDVFTAAEFEIKQVAVAVSISGLEMLQNSGKEKMIDLLESRIKNAERTFINNLSADCYSDGTADGGKQVGGLQLLVADDPTTGTVGGINRATWSFWRNQKIAAVADKGVAVSESTIQRLMLDLWLSQCRNADKPDLIVADDNYYSFFEQSQVAIQRMTKSDMADAGFQALKFHSADVVFDGGLGGDCPTNRMYFLNTNYIHFRPHRDRDIVPLGGERESVNQDAMVKLIGWAGNMTLSNAELQGVLLP